MSAGKPLLLIAIFAASCATNEQSLFDTPPVLGKTTDIMGYVSTQRERLGIYPAPDWKLRDNEVCYFVGLEDISRFGWSHGDKINVQATIGETGCGVGNTVCFQRCNKYMLTNISLK